MSTIFGLSSNSRTSGFDFSVLNDYYAAKTQAQTAPRAAVTRKADSVAAANVPWLNPTALTTPTARLRDAMGTTSFVDTRASDINKAGIPADQKKLFAIYKGLSRLQALATRAADATTVDGERAALNKRFTAGISEIKSYLSDKEFDALSLQFSEKASKVDTGFRKPRPPTLYQGPSLVTGSPTTQLSGITGTEKFTVTVVKSGGNLTVPMDLSQISGGINVESVIGYMNQQLDAAGAYSRFTMTTFAGKTSTDPKSYGIGVQTVATEKLSMAADVSSPALYVGGVSGSGASQIGQLQKLTDDGSSVSSSFTSKITPKTGITDVRATTTDSSGSVYVVGTATGDLGAGEVQAEQDVYLRKYDGAGQLVWSRLLGSSDSATGYAVATDSSGNVAIAGKTSDKLTAKAVGGGDDSFVTKFDSDGREIFTRQISPRSDDQANALAFGSDGSLYVAGQTDSAMNSSVTANGGTDAYLMKLSSTGSLDYVRQFGSSGEDLATALAVDSNGDVVVGTMESGAATIHKFSAADGSSPAVWSLSLGSLGQGMLSSVVVDGGAVYAGGSTTNTSLDAGGSASIATVHSGGSDGFVMKISDQGSSAAAQFTSYAGTSGTDSGVGLAVSNGSVYIAGSTSGSLSGGMAPEKTNAFIRKLDSSGATVWTHQYEGTQGTAAARSVSVDSQGGSVLDRLGLPRGEISFDETRSVTAGSSVRAGDHFYVKVNEGSKLKVTVDAGDTMRSLARKVSNLLLLKGSAEVSRTGGDGIRITAKEGNTIELIAGSEGLDALAGLGIDPVRLDANKKSAATKSKSFSLGLKTDVAIGEKLKANTVTYQLGTAMEVIKNAYLHLSVPAKAAAPQAPVTNQRALASYQTALAALGG